jgi:hypothetical protein
MRIVLKKNLKIGKNEILLKDTEGVLVGCSWGDRYNGEMFHIVIKDKKYCIDKAYCHILNV